MEKTISKFDIVKALVNEPKLEKGYWFTPTLSTKNKLGQQPKRNCAVCAVGSILRAMSFEKWARKNKCDLNNVATAAVKSEDISSSDKSQIPRHLQEKNYLAALSCYFESGKSRLECIKFVVNKFPKELTIELFEDYI